MRPLPPPTPPGPARPRPSWLLVVAIASFAAMVAAPLDGGVPPARTVGGGPPPPPPSVEFAGSVTGGATDAPEVRTVGTLAAALGDLYLCAVSTRFVREVESVTGFGLDWTRLASQCAANGQTSLEVWVGSGAPTGGTVTARLDRPASAVITVVRVVGADWWAPVGGAVAANANGPGGGCEGGLEGAAAGIALEGVREASSVFGFLAAGNAWADPGAGTEVFARDYWGTDPEVAGVVTLGRGDSGTGTATLEATLHHPVDWAMAAVEIRPLGTTEPPVLHVEPTEARFGEVLLTGAAGETFEIRNEGARDLSILSASLAGAPSAEFSLECEPVPFVIAPGGVAELVVRFAPRTAGPKEAILRIMSDDPARTRLDLPLSGEGDDAVPAAGIDRARLDFGSVLVAPPPAAPSPRGRGDPSGVLRASVTGQPGSATASVQLRNDGAGALVLAAATVTGGDAADFRLAAGGAPAVLAPGETRELVVSFEPSTVGLRGSALRIETNDPDDPALEVALLGWGVASTSPDIDGAPTVCEFGPVQVGRSVPRSIHVRNVGASDLHVTGAGLAGSNGTDFRVGVGGGTFTLPPGGVRQIDVNFVPTGTGTRAAVLRLESDDPDEPWFDIALGGIGVPSLDVAVRFEESAGGGASDGRVVATEESLLGVPGNVYVAAVAARRLRAVTELTGLGLEWHRVRAQCSARSQTGVELWVAQGDALSGRVTARLDHSAKNATIVVARYSGVQWWAPAGVSASVNTNGGGGTCGTEGTDADSWAVGLAPVTRGACALAVVAARQRVSAPSRGVTLRADVRSGEGADAASVMLVDRPVVIDGATILDGTFDAAADFAAIGLELRPLGSSPNAPDITLPVPEVDAGAVVLGESEEITFPVHNEGTTPLEITEVSILGAAGGEFSLTGAAAPRSVPAGGFTTVEIRFAPAATGERAAFVRIESNDPDESPAHVRLAGRGTELPPGRAVSFVGGIGGAATGASVVTTEDSIEGDPEDVFVAVVTTGRTYEPVVSVSGLGIPWALVRAQCSGLARTGVEIWLGRGRPTPGPVTATLAGVPENVVLWVGRYAGAHPDEPIGAIFTANANGPDGACDVGTDGTSYAALVESSSPNAYLLGAVAKRERTHVPGEGWTARRVLSRGIGKATAGLAIVDRTVPSPGLVAFEGAFDAEVHWAIAAIELVGRPDGPEPTEIAPVTAGEPLRLEVHGNPARGSRPLDLRFALPADGAATLEIFDVRGRRVRTLVQGPLARGAHRATWRGDDAGGRPVGSGVYFVRLSTAAGSVVRKVAYLR